MFGGFELETSLSISLWCQYLIGPVTVTLWYEKSKNIFYLVPKSLVIVGEAIRA